VIGRRAGEDACGPSKSDHCCAGDVTKGNHFSNLIELQFSLLLGAQASSPAGFATMKFMFGKIVAGVRK